MITFDSGLFHLYNKEISYVMGVNSHGVLEHLYFGKKLSGFHRKNFISSPDYNFQFFDGKEFVNPDPFYENVTQTEVGSFLRNDLKPASFILEQDGDDLTDFRFAEYRIGGRNLYGEGIPHVRRLDQEDALEIICKDARRNVELHLFYTLLEENVLIRSAKIVNRTDGEIVLKRAMSLTLDLPFEEQRLIHFPGQWANERNFCKEELAFGLKTMYSLEGRSGHLENPFFILQSRDTTEDWGSCMSFNLVYSGNFKNEIFVSSFRGMRVNVGINDDNFSFRLKPGESFSAPEAILCFSDRGLNDLSATNHRLIQRHILPEKSQMRKPLLFNSWEGAGMDFSTESILRYMKKSKKIGTELFVLDDGWFSSRNDDRHGLGDWTVNRKKIDLKKIADACHELGMKFGIWIEPEMVNADTSLFRDENLIAHPDLEKRFSRNQLVLDFSNEAIVDGVLHQIADALKDIPVDYIKYDMNRYLGDVFSFHTAQGEIFHRYVLGVYRFMDGLLKIFPDILLENCASGGGRFDLGMLYFSPQIWCSDETDPVRRLYIQYGTSYGYPLQTMASHVSKAKGIYESKAMIAFFGTYGYEMNPTLLTKEEIEILRKFNRLYRLYHEDVIENGRFYRLSSPFESDFGAFMCVNDSKSTAIVLFHNLRKETNQYRFLKLKGLNKNIRYRWRDEIFTGDYLMNVGLNLSYFMEQNSTQIFLIRKTVKGGEK